MADITKPTGLLARTLKSRYFPTTSFLEATTGPKPSYGWTSLLHGKEFLRQGLRWQLGDGHVNIWADNWLPSDPPRPALNFSNSPLQWVSDLWDGRDWNFLSSQILTPIDHDLAIRLYVPQQPQPDTLVWNFSKDGTYTVKSGYHFAVSLQPVLSRYTPPTGDTVLLARMWKSLLPPKYKHFLWKACTSSLSTCATLANRGLPVNPLCPRCHLHPETANHLLFTCPHATQAWNVSQCPTFLATSPAQTLEANLTALFDYMKMPLLTASQKLLPFALLWSLWKSCNALVFNATRSQPLDDVQQSVYESSAWTSHSSPSHVPPTPRTYDPWTPPPQTWHKCNYDARFHDTNALTGLGWIVHSSSGQCVFAGNASVRRSSSALQAEAFGFLHALQHSWARGIRCIIMEGDCLPLVHIINSRNPNLELNNLLGDIYFWMSKFAGIKVVHTPRHNNNLAHQLAQQANLNSVNCCITELNLQNSPLYDS